MLDLIASSNFDVVLALVFLLIAAVYSSVGHAGASGYIAAMTLLGLSDQSIRPIALSLNVLVASIALIRFSRAQLVRWRIVLPFVLGSMPMAFWAAQWTLPVIVFKWMLAIVLIFAAFKLLQRGARSPSMIAQATDSERMKLSTPAISHFNLQRWWLALCVGAVIGAIAGVTGTGGAIFLTPLLLFMQWAGMRPAAGISAAFVLCTSIAGLFGLDVMSTNAWPQAMPLWLTAVAVGALIGSHLGIKRWNERRLQQALGLVLMIAAAKLLLV